MTHRGPFQPLLFCDSVILSPVARGRRDPRDPRMWGCPPHACTTWGAGAARGPRSADDFPYCRRGCCARTGIGRRGTAAVKPTPVKAAAESPAVTRDTAGPGWRPRGRSSWGRDNRRAPGRAAGEASCPPQPKCQQSFGCAPHTSGKHLMPAV